MTLVACCDGRGAAAGVRAHDAMGNHAMMQGADGVASPGQAEPWKETVHETGERADQHAAAEAEGRAHMLEVGLVDRSGMFGEAAKHLTESRRRRWNRLANFAALSARMRNWF